jgi:hypothetical protein
VYFLLTGDTLGSTLGDDSVFLWICEGIAMLLIDHHLGWEDQLRQLKKILSTGQGKKLHKQCMYLGLPASPTTTHARQITPRSLISLQQYSKD